MASCHRRPRKIRRTGQHAAPSALARRAVWAAPAIVAAGALTWSWQWMGTGPPSPVAAQMVHLNPQTPHRADISYTVQPGDSLSTIAQRFYGTPRYWPGLYNTNRAAIGGDPTALDAGIVLRVPFRPDARAKTPLDGQRHAVYRPQHVVRSVVVPESRVVPEVPEVPEVPAAPAVPVRPVIPAAPVVPAAPAAPERPAVTAAPAASAAPATQTNPHASGYNSPGTYSHDGLEHLWTAAGGSPATAARAACIAEHESSGRPGVVSPSNCYGLWQEMGRPDARDPATSARIAVNMSHGGTNWSAWSTAGSC